jgi:hypothetical protein
MPRVQVPQYNTYIDFPDGTDPAVMKSVLAKQFPKKEAAPAPSQSSKDAESLGSLGTNPIVSGVGQAGGRIVGTVQRAFGYDDAADEAFRNVGRLESARREKDPGMTGAVLSAASQGGILAAPAVGTAIATGGVAIPLAMGVATGGAIAGSGAITEAKDAGVSADALTAFVGAEVGIDAAINGILGVTGGQAVSGPIKAGMREVVKRLGVNIGAAEIGLIADQLTRNATNINPAKTEDLFRMGAEAALTAGVTQGAFEVAGAPRAGRARKEGARAKLAMEKAQREAIEAEAARLTRLQAEEHLFETNDMSNQARGNAASCKEITTAGIR